MFVKIFFAFKENIFLKRFYTFFRDATKFQWKLCNVKAFTLSMKTFLNIVTFLCRFAVVRNFPKWREVKSAFWSMLQLLWKVMTLIKFLRYSLATLATTLPSAWRTAICIIIKWTNENILHLCVTFITWKVKQELLKPAVISTSTQQVPPSLILFCKCSSSLSLECNLIHSRI